MTQEIYWDEETRLYGLYERNNETDELTLVKTAETVEELFV